MRRRWLGGIGMLLALALVAAACGEDEGAALPDEIVVGHLSYHTGDFGVVGPWFDASTDFAIALINEDPPLGIPLRAIHQDIGTIGEAAAAQKLLEQDGTTVLLNPAHNYGAYRDFMLDWQAENNLPLMPSVHGGSISSDIGGIASEPIMRGAPMDTAQATAALIVARDQGAQAIALMATEVEGSQLQMDSATQVAVDMGLNVVLELNVPPDQASYRAEIERIGDSGADWLLFFSQAPTGGTVVKQAAEAGLSLNIIGTSEWTGGEFPEGATMEAINQHRTVWVSAFSPVDSPAWTFYEPKWTAQYAGVVDQPAENSYTIQYYDVINVTALAIEKAGSLDANLWIPAMREVAMAPGTVCYSYGECVTHVRAGTDIDYFGVTGDMNYTDTGVVTGAFAMWEWQDEATLNKVLDVDGDEVLSLDIYG
ncbi:MAG: ABC transporter substrate-binding protein [Acidimicrobiia bacterium]